MDPPVLQLLRRKLINGNHILHHHGILDAYGHLSVRHPFDPDIFIMSRNIAPGLLSSPDDLIEYSVSTGQPLASSSPEGFVERHIHSEIYARHPDVHSVAHSHAEAVLPYTIAVDVPLRACTHMAGFLGAKPVPVYDVAAHTETEGGGDLLVREGTLARELARHFDDGCVVALMRGHGFTAVAEKVELAVLRAIYTQKNAVVQTTAMTLCAAVNPTVGDPGRGIKFLSEEEAVAAANMTRWSANRPWRLWLREVEESGLYVNQG
ncbi:class II aldolase and Adducin N-terminal domain-containing protein [Podospora conica]|nr:class II aldolase and Adducin N-terminal domain-containing protein [Schizothecium conicum]